MQRAKENDNVTVIYDGAVQNGETFESSSDTGPLEFTLGTQSVIPLFEDAVLGMAVDETKSITVPPTDAYGDRVEALVQNLDRAIFKDKEILPGMTLSLDMKKDGKTHKVPATVTAVNTDTVTVDFNHPLAGEILVYTITLKEIRPAQ